MINHDAELSALGAAWPIGWSPCATPGWYFCKLTDSVLVRAYRISSGRRVIGACHTDGIVGVAIEHMPSVCVAAGPTWPEAVSALRKVVNTGFETATTLIRFLPPRDGVSKWPEIPPDFDPMAAWEAKERMAPIRGAIEREDQRITEAKLMASGQSELPPDFQPPSSTRMEPAEPPTFQTLAAEVAKLVESKQAAYGDSFGRSGDILRVLYPHGIEPEQYTDALAVVRVVEKLFRVATDKSAFGEDPWRDIMGYALLAVAREGRG